MSLTGKGFYVWKIWQCEGGDSHAIASLAQRANLSHVLIKVADGIGTYNLDLQTKVDLVPGLVSALHARGIQAWGWQYVYGNNPVGEARIASRRIQELNLDGFVINAEAEYKQPGKKDAATAYMRQLRSTINHIPIGLSSYRYPSVHPQLPWREFLDRCDINMPQVYWLQATNPAAQLRRCLREFQALSPFRRIIPTGAAFAEHGWQPTPQQVLEFMDEVKLQDLDAANFWSWDNARTRLPAVWEAISGYAWEGPPVTLDVTQNLVNFLNDRDYTSLVSLYHPSAAFVTPQRTVQGHNAIRDYYARLLDETLAGGKITQTRRGGTGNTRQMTWTLDSRSGRILNGSDTIGLLDGKIAYHFSSYAITPAG